MDRGMRTERSQGEVTSARDLLEHYANSGYRVTDVSVEHPVPESSPTRNEVTVELTLTEPVDSVLDRLEDDENVE
jgi:hypothetical protein